ncbi:MAG: hypothetical protein IJR60_07240 [Eubacterium sp.]|nr:hypothetical protein [Eubacterium sp.]
MKNYKYITTVLSHITNKREKDKIEYELYDHLDEKEKWFEQCGFEKEAAANKADESMGDGDVVGEQLEAIKKSFFAKGFPTMLANLCLFSAFYTYVELIMTGAGSKYDGPFYEDMRFLFTMPHFESFARFTFVFVFGLITMTVGLKRLNKYAFFAGFAVAEMVVVLGPYHYSDVINKLIRGEDYLDFFFKQDYFSNAFFSVSGTFNTVLIVVFGGLLLAAFICGLRIFGRTKRLENTRRDLSVKKVVVYILAAASLLCACCFTALTTQIANEREYRKAEATEQLEFTQSQLIKQIDKLNTADKKAHRKAFDEYLKSVESAVTETKTDDSLEERTAKNNYLEIYEYYFPTGDGRVDEDLYDSYYNNLEKSEHYYLHFNSFYGDPFSLYNDRYESFKTSEDLSCVKDLSDLPLPADIEFTTGDGAIVSVDYDDDKELEFEYNKKTKRFELVYNSEAKYETVDLTKKQIEALKAEIRNYDAPESKDELLWLQIHTAFYNKVADAYMIEFSYHYYTFIPTSGIYSTANHTHGCLGDREAVKFDGDTANVVWSVNLLYGYYIGDDEDESDNYSSTEALISDIEDYYSKESIKKIRNEKLIENLNIIIESDYYKTEEADNDGLYIISPPQA